MAPTRLRSLVTIKGIALAALVVSGAAIAANRARAPMAHVSGDTGRSVTLVIPAESANETTKTRAPAAPSAAAEEILRVQDLPLVASENRAEWRTHTANQLSAELSLIERARAVLGRSPSETLSITRRYQSTFPNGQMRAAADLLAVEALRRLGRSTEAAQMARAASLRDPDGIYAERLERAMRRQEP